MKIKAIAPWFGSKRTLAPRIVAELGDHAAYWEPFCGSMAVLLAKEPVTAETVNDLNGDLVNLARVLQSEKLAGEIYGRAARTLMHEDWFRENAAAWKKTGRLPAGEKPDLERAYRYLVCSWMGMNGVAGTQSYNQGFCARYTKNGGHAGTRWRAMVESIPWWHERLFAVQILSRCGIELCSKIEDGERVVIYVDPPYLKKGAKYIHDFEAVDHIRLATALRRFKRTRVVVSYYDDPQIQSLYPGWTKIDCAVAKSMVQGGMRDKRGAVVAPEILLVNGPSFTILRSLTTPDIFGMA